MRRADGTRRRRRRSAPARTRPRRGRRRPAPGSPTCSPTRARVRRRTAPAPSCRPRPPHRSRRPRGGAGAGSGCRTDRSDRREYWFAGRWSSERLEKATKRPSPEIAGGPLVPGLQWTGDAGDGRSRSAADRRDSRARSTARRDRARRCCRTRRWRAGPRFFAELRNDDAAAVVRDARHQAHAVGRREPDAPLATLTSSVVAALEVAHVDVRPAAASRRDGTGGRAAGTRSSAKLSKATKRPSARDARADARTVARRRRRRARSAAWSCPRAVVQEDVDRFGCRRRHQVASRRSRRRSAGRRRRSTGSRWCGPARHRPARRSTAVVLPSCRSCT